MTTPLEQLNSKIFSQHLHSNFTVQLPGAAPVALELIEVMDRDPSPQLELFILHFLGPAGPRLAQQIHRLEHEKLGAFEIFLTAIGAEQRGLLYETVFHRFRKAAP